MQTRSAMPLSLVAVLAVAGPLLLDLATRTESDHGMDVVSGKQGGREIRGVSGKANHWIRRVVRLHRVVSNRHRQRH
jgi:hypothetical protein